MHRIVIVGGGFGGVMAAKELAKKHLRDTQIVLINSGPNLEYYGVLYRLIHGESEEQACLPLTLLLPPSIRIELDTITQIDAVAKTVRGQRSYSYDTLILSPGSVPSYFGIPGMQEHSITMRNAAEAISLRKRILHSMNESKTHRFIVVGGGPTGVEIAGEIVTIAGTHAQVDLIEAMDRVLPMVEPSASHKVQKRIASLGVHVHLQTAVASADTHAITLKDGTRMEADTLIWTAGVKAHPLLESIPGIELDKKGRATVDDQLHAKGHPDIFILGDTAATKFSGMAQTAIVDGAFVAEVIAASQKNKPLPSYKPVAPAYAIPVGNHWAAVKYMGLKTYGLLGYAMRRAADVHVYMLILPWRLIPAVFFERIKLTKH